MNFLRTFTPLVLLAALASGAATSVAAGQELRLLPPITEETLPEPAEEIGPPPVAEVTEQDTDETPVSELSAELFPEATPEPVEPVAHWYNPSYWFGPTPWETGVELGLNGSSGTSDSLSTRTGGFLKRKTKQGKLDTSLYHNRTKSEGEETQNNALLAMRYDWMLGESPWSLYLNNQTFFDKFQAFDLNMNINLGLGYEFVDTDFLKLSTSLGAGAARKFGGRRDDWIPEAQGSVNWEQKVSDTQKFTAKLDYFPEFEDWNNYRLMTDIGWVIELSRPSNVSLKLSLSDRFDSVPDGVNPHNTNYSVLMIWKK